MNPAKRHHPDPAAAAVMAAMHEHQMAAMFAANAVAGMGGQISAESAGTGKGAEFHVLLPVAQGG